MAPFKSSLARSAAKLIGVFNQTDLSLRGASQDAKFDPPQPDGATGGNIIDGSNPGNGCIQA